MAKLTHQQFREAFPDATISAWVKYRYCNGKLPIPSDWKLVELKHAGISYTADGLFFIIIEDREIYEYGATVNGYCNNYELQPTAGISSEIEEGNSMFNWSNTRVWFKDSRYDNVTDFRNNNLNTIVYYKPAE